MLAVHGNPRNTVGAPWGPLHETNPEEDTIRESKVDRFLTTRDRTLSAEH